MKKIALLSALVLLSASVAAGRIVASARGDAHAGDAHAGAAHVARVAVDDPPPEPVECPLCGGNPTLHARRMLVIETLQAHFLTAALRW